MTSDELRSLADEATPGPWATGEIISGNVNPGPEPRGLAKIPPGCCLWCYLGRDVFRDDGEEHIHRLDSDTSVMSPSALATVVGDIPDYSQTWGGVISGNKADTLLIALAPDLARLCADLGEALGVALVVIENDRGEGGYEDWRELLAKFSELEAR